MKIFLNKTNPADNIARGEQKTGDHQFLDAVGVGSRRVENRNSRLGASFHRDIVHADAGAGDCFQVGREN